MLIFAIDPGNTQSGYALLLAQDNSIQAIIRSGKINNAELREMLAHSSGLHFIAIEMVSHYGKNMAPGATTFETCVAIGRYIEIAERDLHMPLGKSTVLIYRREEKLNLLGSATGKDSDLRIALVDRFAPGASNFGKGTKAAPGFFHGVSKDAWQAVAVGVTAYDKHITGITI